MQDDKNAQGLENELGQVKKERDAAVADINDILSIPDGILCHYCKHFDKEGRCCALSSEVNEKGCKGEWRGIVEEKEK